VNPVRFTTRYLPVAVIALAVNAPAHAQSAIPGRVFDLESGEPIEGVRIELRTQYNIRSTRGIEDITSADGMFELVGIPDGDWHVVAYREKDGIPCRMNTGKFTLSDSTRLDFYMPVPRAVYSPFTISTRFRPPPDGSSGTPSITGTLIDALTFEPIIGGTLNLARLSGPSREDSTIWTESAQTDADGRFQFDGIRPGWHRVSPTVDDHFPMGPLAPMEITGPMRGRIYLLPNTPDSTSIMEAVTRSGYVLNHRREKISYGCRYLGPAYATITGIVLREGRAVPDARILIVDRQGRHLDFLLADTTSLDGRYEIKPILPGEYAIRVIAGDQDIQIPPSPLKYGPNTLDIDL